MASPVDGGTHTPHTTHTVDPSSVLLCRVTAFFFLFFSKNRRFERSGLSLVYLCWVCSLHWFVLFSTVFFFYVSSLRLRRMQRGEVEGAIRGEKVVIIVCTIAVVSTGRATTPQAAPARVQVMARCGGCRARVSVCFACVTVSTSRALPSSGSLSCVILIVFPAEGGKGI